MIEAWKPSYLKTRSESGDVNREDVNCEGRLRQFWLVLNAKPVEAGGVLRKS